MRAPLALSSLLCLCLACSGEKGGVAQGSGFGSTGGSAGNAGSAGSAGGGASGSGTGGAATGGSGNTFGFGGSGGGECTPCASDCCRGVEECLLDTCVVPLGTCTTSDECQDDSYCHEGQCIPFGVPADKVKDDSCERSITIDAIAPAVQCRWTEPPAGDADPLNVHVMATPVVVDFDFDSNSNTLEPSIVFATFPTAGSYSEPGVLRVISGSDCSQQFTFPAAEDAVMSPASVAVGDLDGDGHSEIVAAAHGGGLVAFSFDAGMNQFVRLWRSGSCDGGGNIVATDSTGGVNKWNGPSIHDLDDDGSPELLYGGTVYGANGCLISSTLGFRPYSVGVPTVVADVDEDGKMELIYGNGIYEWDSATSDVVAEPYFAGTALADGFVAIANFGDYPTLNQGGADLPEIVVVSSSSVRVQTIEGTVVFGPVPLPGGGQGGPPTIADFDGDGRREFASAGGSRYVVFDFDCLTGGDAAGCNGVAKTDGVLWEQPSQDQSSNVTGSSVFDFDADGAAEAVYADECFLRIYDGKTGAVKYSAARSSGTTYENPVIVDVDGDFNTEIVSSVNDYAGTLGCPATDPLLATSTYERNRGIVVLRDEQDRWAASRPVWNQHAYAVTHVGNRGEIPTSSSVAHNWNDPALNNFRQNVQGDLEALGITDLTVSGDVTEVQCSGTTATLQAKICNRGTLPMAGGTEVAFRSGSVSGTELCREAFGTFLNPGECDVIECQADLMGQTLDVYVVVDPDETSEECYEGNNVGVFGDLACGVIPK